MSLREAITQNKTGQGLTTLFSLLLLVFNMIGPSRLEGLHTLIHSHEIKVSHSEETEKDPCHRSIYHAGEAARECGHTAHIVLDDTCELCDLIFYTDQVLLPQLSSARLQFTKEPSVYSISASVNKFLASLPSRAPPTM